MIKKFKIIPITDEEYISVRYGCIRFIDSYRFLWSSLDSLVKTLIENNHKTLKNSKEESVDNDERLIFVDEIEIIFKEDGYNNDSIKNLKKGYPDKIIKVEETLLNYMGENDFKHKKKTEIPDKNWMFLTKKNSISIWILQ